MFEPIESIKKGFQRGFVSGAGFSQRMSIELLTERILLLVYRRRDYMKKNADYIFSQTLQTFLVSVSQLFEQP